MTPIGKPIVPSPIVVAYGMGVDSTAMLVLLQKTGVRPDLILFADTGDEKPQTYAYLPTINAWLRSVGFPEVTVVKNARTRSPSFSSGACWNTKIERRLRFIEVAEKTTDWYEFVKLKEAVRRHGTIRAAVAAGYFEGLS